MLLLNNVLLLPFCKFVQQSWKYKDDLKTLQLQTPCKSPMSILNALSRVVLCKYCPRATRKMTRGTNLCLSGKDQQYHYDSTKLE